MDQNGHIIYREFVGKIPAEDVARLDGYLRGREDERPSFEGSYGQWQVQVGDGEPVRCADEEEAERVRLSLVAAWVEAWKTAHPECRDAAPGERYFA